MSGKRLWDTQREYKKAFIFNGVVEVEMMMLLNAHNSFWFAFEAKTIYWALHNFLPSQKINLLKLSFQLKTDCQDFCGLHQLKILHNQRSKVIAIFTPEMLITRSILLFSQKFNIICLWKLIKKSNKNVTLDCYANFLLRWKLMKCRNLFPVKSC
jgi:hypothetical protein